MIFTPLLPRPWPSPLAGVGVDHSTCNWQSPNSPFVTMSPPPVTTSTPPSTFHGAGPSPLAGFHLDRSLPSKSTTASEGGCPERSCELSAPGVTTGGWGRVSSWTAHCLALAPPAAANDQ